MLRILTVLVAIIFLGTAHPVGAAFPTRMEVVCTTPAEVPALMDTMVPGGRTTYEADTNTDSAFSIYENDAGNWVAIVVPPNGLFCFVAGNPRDADEVAL